MAVKKPSEWALPDLHEHLMAAIELELLTLPPYLTALHSLEREKNEKAAEIVESVAMEEMLHFALAANVMNAVGGKPDLTGGGFVPRYPAAFPLRRRPHTFEIDLQPFSKAALEVFMAIEKPNHPEVEPPPASADAAIPRVLELAEENEYGTIGAFYRAVEEGLKALGEGIFTGEASRQIPPGFYGGGGGGGHLIEVTNLAEAQEALEQIIEQGEGDTDKPGPGEEFDAEGDLAHFYRFKELYVGREYQKQDAPETPTGPPIAVDFDAVFPMKPNLRAEELSGQAREAAEQFNTTYSEMLGLLQEGIDGNPSKVGPAIRKMIVLGGEADALLQMPLGDGSGLHAGPPWQFLSSP